MEFLEFPKMVYGPDGADVIVQNAQQEAAFVAQHRAPPTREQAEEARERESAPEPEPATVPNAAAEAPEAPAEMTAEERKRQAKNKKQRERRAAAKQAHEE